MLWPDQPEYLQLFSNEGPVTIRVKFNDKLRSMPQLRMHWKELQNLCDSETGAPYLYMFFDAHKCLIKRYELTPEKNMLTIVVEKTE